MLTCFASQTFTNRLNRSYTNSSLYCLKEQWEIVIEKNPALKFTEFTEHTTSIVVMGVIPKDPGKISCCENTPHRSPFLLWNICNSHLVLFWCYSVVIWIMFSMSFNLCSWFVSLRVLWSQCRLMQTPRKTNRMLQKPIILWRIQHWYLSDRLSHIHTRENCV